jgi:hypothetical protein
LSQGSKDLSQILKIRQQISGAKERRMAELAYVAKANIERKKGPLRYTHLAGESSPVIFSAHGAIAAHYGVNPADIGESHATTLDYLVATVAG